MFEWNWDSIAAECASFIGPAGKLPDPPDQCLFLAGKLTTIQDTGLYKV